MLTVRIALEDSKADGCVKNIKENTTFIIDLTATIHTMTNLPKAYEEFYRNSVSTLPRGPKQLNIVAHTHRENSIKGGEKSTCGSSEKVVIASCMSKLHRDFSVFMKNGENKTRLI